LRARELEIMELRELLQESKAGQRPLAWEPSTTKSGTKVLLGPHKTIAVAQAKKELDRMDQDNGKLFAQMTSARIEIQGLVAKIAQLRQQLQEAFTVQRDLRIKIEQTDNGFRNRVEAARQTTQEVQKNIEAIERPLRHCSSTRIKPLSSTATPARSRPMSLVLGCLSTATRTQS